MADDRRRPGHSDMHRARRGRNIAMLLILLGLVVLFYLVTLVRMGD